MLRQMWIARPGFLKGQVGVVSSVFAFLAISFLTAQLVLNLVSINDAATGVKTLPGADTGQAQARVNQAYQNSPISFEANQGQLDEQVKYFARGEGYTFSLTPNEAFFSLRKPVLLPPNQAGGFPLNPTTGAINKPAANLSQVAPAVVRMKFDGANPAPEVISQQEQSSKTNYYMGTDPSKWRTEVANFGRVLYKQIYPNIDLVYYGNSQGKLEYDFVVAPGADPSLINLNFEGVERLELNGQGDLVLRLPDGDLTQPAPVIYQERGKVKEIIKGNYRLSANNRVTFDLGQYDKSLPLVIDPTLAYSTYLGGSLTDFGIAIDVDSNGAAYVTGYTGDLNGTGDDLNNFPIKNAYDSTYNGGQIDTFISKFNPDGSLAYSTYLGGNANEQGNDIAVDSTGAVYVTGNNERGGFPVLNPYQANPSGFSDGFVVKLGSSGTLVYSTYLGGNSDDSGSGIAVDSSGVAYIVGYTTSANFPLASPNQPTIGGNSDGFFAKLSANGTTLSYSTFLGGTDNDSLGSIALDSSNAAYVSGYTDSSNFPTASPLQPSFGGSLDGIAAKFNSSGSLVYSTYLGGSNLESASGIAVNGAGEAYIAGFTMSSNFTTLNPYQATLHGTDDGFIVRLNANGSLAYSTYFGGQNVDRISDIGVDSTGAYYVIGQTFSNDLPTLYALQPNLATQFGTNSGVDVFITKFNSDNTLGYSTFFGSESADEQGFGIAVQSNGNIYVTGYTTYNPFYSTKQFPLRRAAQPIFGDRYDAFVAKINRLGAVVNTPTQSALQTALTQAAIGGGDVVFAANVTQITLTSDLQIPVGVNLFGGCGENGPKLELKGSGILQMQGSNQLEGILLQGITLTNLGNNNLLSCTVIRKTANG